MGNQRLYVLRGRNKGRPVGYFKHENKTYYKVVNFKTHQMFQHKKYIGNIAISQSIIAQLQSLKCQKIQIQVVGYEPKGFDAVITLSDFVKNSVEIGMDDKQLMTHMSHFQRLYYDQEQL